MKMVRPLQATAVLCTLLCAAFTAIQAQQPLDYGLAFPQQEVTNIYITLDPDSLDWMLANLENEHEFPATFVFESQSLSDTVSLVGFRLRGNTSLNAAKKSFKISFNTFDAGADWQQLEKVNLLATVNDPSLMRCKLSHDLYRKAGIAAARTSYTNLYINGEYRGVYLNVEHIDEQMTAKNFDHQGDGNLYKCTYPADLDFISNTPDDYKFALWGYRHYELKTNDYLDDYTDLATFIAALNNTPAANLHCVLPEKFHVSEYLKIAAIDVLLGNWDGYIFNKNNFYLYHDQLTNRLHYIPYDLDNTFGIDWFGMDWSERAIYTWSQPGEERPLYTRLIQNEDYRESFSKHIDELCTTFFHPDTLAEQIAHWQTLLAPHVAADAYYSLDFGYSLSDFSNAPWEGCCNHVPLGILPFIEARRLSALSQLEPYPAQSADAHWIVQRIDTNAVTLGARIEGTINSAQANYSWDGLSFFSGTLSNNGNDLYTFDGPLFNTAYDKLFYRGILNGSTSFPCTPDFHWMTRSPIGIRINEACASNQSLNSDNAGEFDDWVELYNTTGNSILLSNCFLTDDPSNWNRWQLPDTLLPAHGFVLLWLDDDLEQGRQHANFKLNAAEELLLYRWEEGKPRIVDRASGFSPVANQTWSLITDGASESTLTTGTPGYSNNSNHAENHHLLEPALFPCPASYTFFWPQQNTGQLWDAQGVLLMDEILPGLNSCAHLAAGVYFIKNDQLTYRLLIAR